MTPKHTWLTVLFILGIAVGLLLIAFGLPSGGITLAEIHNAEGALTGFRSVQVNDGDQFLRKLGLALAAVFDVLTLITVLAWKSRGRN